MKAKSILEFGKSLYSCRLMSILEEIGRLQIEKKK